MTPQEVAALLQNPPAAGDQAQVARLRDVLGTVKQLWETRSTDLDLIAEQLGNGSREAKWRLPIGESGLLDFFVQILQQDNIRPALKTHSLRLVGNACADEDENRARVAQGSNIAGLMRLLQDDGALPYAIPVLYNICVDYEPAQRQACEAGLSRQLIELLTSPSFGPFRHLLGLISKLLSFMASQDVEKEMMNPATPSVLLELVTSNVTPVDLGTWNDLVSVALAYLANDLLHATFLQDGGFPLIQKALSDSYIRLDSSIEDEDEVAELKQLQTGIVKLLSDLSAEPTFASLHPIGSSAVNELLAWLKTPTEYISLQVGACLCLGNLARSDTASMKLLPHAFPPLTTLLSRSQTLPPGPTTTHLLHAILSLLKHLAIPAANKGTVGTLLDPPDFLLVQNWASPAANTNQQLQFAAISLTRLLIAGSPINVRRFCAPLSQDPSSPAYERSNLHILITLFEGLDAEPSKMEAARAVAAVCRVLHSTPVLPAWMPESDSLGEQASSPAPSPVAGTDLEILSNGPAAYQTSRLMKFYESEPDLIKPLMYLISQKRFPALRSEAWFVFALMSRTQEGARVVIRVLQPYESMQALVEAVTGKDLISGNALLAKLPSSELEEAGSSSKALEDVQMSAKSQEGATPFTDAEGLGLEPQPIEQDVGANMQRVDRENALVMVAELLRNHAEHLSPPRQQLLDELLRTGGESIMAEKGQ